VLGLVSAAGFNKVSLIAEAPLGGRERGVGAAQAYRVAADAPRSGGLAATPWSTACTGRQAKAEEL
jgi:hypothetical protein